MTFAGLPIRVQRAFSLAQTRCFSSVPLSALLQRLSGRIGSESAKLELGWMREEIRVRGRAAPNASSISHVEWEHRELEKMVDRRFEGEPLQYILGGYGSISPMTETSLERNGCP